MKKFRKVILSCFVIISLLGIYVYAEENEPENQVTIEELSNDKKREQLEEQKEELEEESAESNEKLQFISEELSATVVEVSELNQSIYDKQVEIDELTAKSEKLAKRIKKVNKQLNKATEEFEGQKDLLEKRLVAMYEMGNTSYLEMLLSSKGLSELISNYYYISEVASTDTELLNQFREQKEKKETLMGKLTQSEEELGNTRSNLEKSTIAMSNMVIIKNQKVQSLTEEELAMQKEVEEYQAQIQEIESEIRLLSLTSDNSTYVGGRMAWPVPGYTRISSPFGMRTHPITGVYKLHTGTDISAPMGATFIASNDGIVAKAEFNRAYGNMVIIDHGGGITTLYAHGSEILVQPGQVVSQGTPVLKVGSTGYSTGPHAHFEIRVNGEYINPMEYISPDNAGVNTKQFESTSSLGEDDDVDEDEEEEDDEEEADEEVLQTENQ